MGIFRFTATKPPRRFRQLSQPDNVDSSCSPSYSYRRRTPQGSTPRGEAQKNEALDLQGLRSGGDSWTRTNDPFDVNEVLSHHGRDYKPLSKPGSLSNPLFSMVAATLAHLHNSRNWLVYPSVYPVHNSRTQAYTKPAVHKNGHQILLWCCCCFIC